MTTVSLVVTTYNWKEALRLVLASALVQSRLPDEIIVADDGSRPDTGELVDVMAAGSPVPLIHSWQEDQGFRAAMGRNRAIARATGDYIVLIDGDMLLEPHFIADHLAVARPGRFVQGSRVLLAEQRTRQVLAEGVTRIAPLASGIENRKNCIRSRWLSALFSHAGQGLNGIKTCNFAFWRRDALAVNGFNEEFVGWGREDSEFAARLLNNGIQRYTLKFMATAYHLFHPVQPRDRLPANDDLLARVVSEKTTWCAHGIGQYLGDDHG